jgi:hypothetical protein
MIYNFCTCVVVFRTPGHVVLLVAVREPLGDRVRRVYTL